MQSGISWTGQSSKLLGFGCYLGREFDVHTISTVQCHSLSRGQVVAESTLVIQDKKDIQAIRAVMGKGPWEMPDNVFLEIPMQLYMTTRRQRIKVDKKSGQACRQ